MNYKIAVASSDSVNIDLHFADTEIFRIYEVNEGTWSFLEERALPKESSTGTASHLRCGGSGDRCCTEPAYKGGLRGDPTPKTDIISDCRCVVCLKIGFQVQKQLERRAISAFDADCTIEEALEKITCYYKRIDRHRQI